MVSPSVPIGGTFWLEAWGGPEDEDGATMRQRTIVRTSGTGARQRAQRLAVAVVGAIGVLAVACTPGLEDDPPPEEAAEPVLRPLPQPSAGTQGSLESAIEARRSVRDLDPRALTDEQVGRLLWATQGVTDPTGLRAAPSAGATYPLEVYVVTAERVARYVPAEHALVDHLDGDRRGEVVDVSYDQDWMADASLIVVIAAVEARTADQYGDRAERYVLIEVGHAAQNLLLQATALGLAGTPVGAFDADALSRALALPEEHAPLYLVPIGHPTG
jgi:SagB-type dehydrogenase family enzyme